MTPSSTSSYGNAPKLAGLTLTYCLKLRKSLNAGCPKLGASSPAATSSTFNRCPRLYTLPGTSPSISPKTLRCPLVNADGGAPQSSSSKTNPAQTAYCQLGLNGIANPTIYRP